LAKANQASALTRALLALGDELGELLNGRFSGADVAGARSANGAGPERGVLPVLAQSGNGQSGGFFPAVQLEGGPRSKIGAIFGPILLARPHDMVGMLDDFACFGFLPALKVGVAQEVHRVRLIVRFGQVHFRGMSA
jgi:hypothetical protein